jgi:hypothetical protein
MIPVGSNPDLLGTAVHHFDKPLAAALILRTAQPLIESRSEK